MESPYLRSSFRIDLSWSLALAYLSLGESREQVKGAVVEIECDPEPGGEKEVIRIALYSMYLSLCLL